ncbi:sorbosone dehydrogenase family protein [Janthinobacterium sp. hw3]|uniref:Sorbosone dehydrogenase family protein n=2 Tax=Janthinobacterium fluminis TaxID=2987524 RepID=A0ABT5K3J4_9BURK|nr:sorbosone dehydrogenase family protein [Janthinobacterium fluminis]MDC8759545.1 sorbosone dehydrogenase family protein [Janthinobacterium fluminis]
MPPGFGPNPALPEPRHSLIPTINAAPAKPWQGDARPLVAPGFAVSAYARDLAHPRWLYVLPNGDVLVAETQAPPKPADGKGIKGLILRSQMKKAGAAGDSANRITLLRDIDANGVAKTRSVFLQGLNSPFGMALVGEDLYVANTDALLRFPYQQGQTAITAAGVKVMDLPGGPLNHHWTKNLVASRDGAFLYVAVGSNSNAGERGVEAEAGRAAIWQFERASGKARLYASGLRNPVGMDWQPHSGALWVAVNERDELGDDLVPDYMTQVKDGAFYGWPYSYFGQHVDARVKPPRPDLVARAVAPDYALGAHTASLGLAFYDGQLFPASFHGGAFIGQHGSWNRKPHSGYKVIFVPFSEGRPSGPPQDFVAGFLDEFGNARGRPVGVAVDGAGALLVADDVGNVVWRVTPAARR